MPTIHSIVCSSKVGERYNSKVVIANAWHHRSDSLSSLVALLGVGGALLGYPYLDPVGGLIVAGMIAKMGFDTGERRFIDFQVLSI